MRVWCVEDDAAIRDIEIYALRSAGFMAEGFADGADFLEALQTQRPDLVVLDVMLPGMDGVALLNQIRHMPKTADLPVIMATARGAEYDKIQSLDLGADDYVVKPFGVMELVSRVRAVLRRSAGTASPRLLCLRGLVLNLKEHTVCIDGKRIGLTYKEYELLRLFLSHPGMAFTREQLFAEVWGENFLGETRTLDMHIRTLRQKIGDYARYIETVRNVGYRLEEKP